MLFRSEYETIDSDQIDDIMKGKTPRPPKSWDDKGSGSGPEAPASAESQQDMTQEPSDDVDGKPVGDA